MKVELGDANPRPMDVAGVVQSLLKQGYTEGVLAALMGNAAISKLDDVIDAWKIHRDVVRERRIADELDALASLVVELNLLRWLDADELQSAFGEKLAKWSANVRKTRFLLLSHACTSAYKRARRLAEVDAARSDLLHRKTVSLAAGVLEVASPRELEAQEKYARGFRGVSLLFLSFRAAPDVRKQQIKLAVDDLRRTGALGDTSTSRAVYLAEALSELADFERTTSRELLEEAIRSLRGVRDSEVSSDIELLRGRLLVQLGAATREASGGSSAAQFLEAVACYDRGLAGVHKYRVTNARGRRGQALLFLSWETGDAQALDRAVGDLLFAYDAGERQWAPLLVDAYLTRSGQQRSGEDSIKAWKLATNEADRAQTQGDRTSWHNSRIRAAFAAGCNAGDAAAFEEVIKLGAETNPELRAKAIGMLGLHRGDAEMLHEAINLLMSIAKKSTSKGPGLLPKLASQLARMVADTEPDRAVALLEIVNDSLLPSNGTATALQLWLAARAKFDSWRIAGDLADLNDAQHLVERAKEFGEVAPESLIFAANVALQSAKFGSSKEEAIDLLESSLADMRKAQETSAELNEQVGTSKLGESLLRLGILKGSLTLIEEGRASLERSVELGNQSAEVCGLIGDAYYQLSKGLAADRKIKALKAAIEWKQLGRGRLSAISQNRTLREHHSLCARIFEQLLELEALTANHSSSAWSELAFARKADPAWPWPVCQMAELLVKSPQGFADDPEAAVQEAVSAGNADDLWRYAAKLTLASNEFRRQILGGKSSVWYAEDDLALVAHVFVFKPGNHSLLRSVNGARRAKVALQEEMVRLERLGDMLSAEGISISVPKVLGVVDAQDGTPVLAMRRLAGLTLADALQRNPARNVKHLRTAVRALAAYHALTPYQERVDERGQQLLRLERTLVHARQLVTNEQFELLRKHLGELLKLPFTARRDAHPGNWFVTTKDSLVVLDVEHPTCKMFLEELCQLVEDIPVYGWSDDDLAVRRALLSEYRDSYSRYLGRTDGLDEMTAWTSYLCFCVLLGCFGSSLSEAQLRRSSLSAGFRGRWDQRREHYRSLTKKAAEQVVREL